MRSAATSTELVARTPRATSGSPPGSRRMTSSAGPATARRTRRRLAGTARHRIPSDTDRPAGAGDTSSPRRTDGGSQRSGPRGRSNQKSGQPARRSARTKIPIPIPAITTARPIAISQPQRWMMPMLPIRWRTPTNPARSAPPREELPAGPSLPTASRTFSGEFIRRRLSLALLTTTAQQSGLVVDDCERDSRAAWGRLAPDNPHLGRAC